MGSLELSTIHKLINAHRAQTHDIWKSLSAILSNRDEASLSQYVRTFLQRQGLTTSLLSSDPTLLYGEMRHETRPTLLHYLNYDPEAPASPQTQAITASLLALSIYQSLLTTRADISPITLKWLLGQKSFSHTLQFQHSIEQQLASLQADACLWYEPQMTERTIQGNPDNLVLATGTKGYLSIELQVQTAHSPLHSSYGAIVPNAAWRLLWALNSLKDQREEVLIEGFYDTMQPLEDEAFQQLADLPDTAATQAAHWGLADLLLGLQGKQMHYAHILTPTCTINMLSSGEDTTIEAKCSIPVKARAIIDFHLVPGQDPADIFTKVERHLHTRGFTDIQITLRYAGAPVYTTLRHSFTQQVMQNAEQVYGRSPIILPLLPEHVPIHTLTSTPAQAVVILPLYKPAIQKHADDEERALWNSIALLTSIMVGYAQ